MKFLLLALLSFLPLTAQVVRTLDGGPIHEAFVMPITEAAVLDAVRVPPPAPIREKIPAIAPDTIWIGGYWNFDTTLNDFIWISGICRRPPADHIWIAGFWNPVEEGFVWIRGFWSPIPQDRLTYITQTPPDLLDETIPQRPSPSFFWMAGYWDPKPNAGFAWVIGRWAEFDPNLIFVQAHYTWRPEGYVFIPAYWDWTIDRRGCVFANIFIEPTARLMYIYEPIVIIEPIFIIQRLFFYYPDYLYIFYHNYHFFPAYWAGFDFTPVWWGWDNWWCYSWHDQWSLWWWYTHPGYPHPVWLSAAMSSKIHAPSMALVNSFKSVKAPLIVTPKGVLPPSKLFDVSKKGKDMGRINRGALILPHDLKAIDKIRETAIPDRVIQGRPIEPTGIKLKEVDIKDIPLKLPTTITPVRHLPDVKVIDQPIKPQHFPVREELKPVTPTIRPIERLEREDIKPVIPINRPVQQQQIQQIQLQKEELKPVIPTTRPIQQQQIQRLEKDEREKK